MAAPMFLVSSPELVIACAQAGILGSFPAANGRDIPALRDWMARTSVGVAQARADAAWVLNMIVHSSYDRFDAELDLVREFQPKLVSTALGSPRRVLDAVHGYGGVVMADVINPTFARKAADAGADVLIVVSHGAGGHTGHYHPFALLAEIRQFWQGPLGLAGAISCGTDIRAAQLLGADFVLAGTRFIATTESLAAPDYRDMVVNSGLEDLVASKAVSGVLANWLKPSLEAAGIAGQASSLQSEHKVDFSGHIAVAPKAWKNVWSAGHGVGGIKAVADVQAVVAALRAEYRACLAQERDTALAWLQANPN